MIKIITAIGNPKIREILSNEKNILIIEKDILYKDAIIEILEKNKKINYIIINEYLPGEINNRKLIKKIKEIREDIKIIFVEIEDRLNQNNKRKRDIKNEEEESIVDIILKEIGIKYDNESDENLKMDNNNLEKIYRIEKENQKESQDFDKNVIKEYIGKLCKQHHKKILKKPQKKRRNLSKNKVIVIAGNSGSGKSLMLANLSYFFSINKSKVLILENSENNNNIKTIFGIANSKESSKIEKDKIYIKLKSIEVNKRLYVSDLIDIKPDVKQIIDKGIYNLLFIEMSNLMDENLRKEILKICDKIIFIVEPNLIGIKNIKDLINNYEKIFKIKSKKIKILINKKNKFSINTKLLKNIFYKYEIIGKIKFNYKYDFFINNNYKKIIFNRRIKNEFNKIIKKI